MAQNLELDAWHRGAINNNTFGFENAYIFTTVVLKLICMGSSINHVYRQIATLLHKPYLVDRIQWCTERILIAISDEVVFLVIILFATRGRYF